MARTQATAARREPRWRLNPRARRLALTVHVCASVGWIGVEAALIALGLTGLTTGDPAVLRASYVAMGLLGSVFLIPVGAATLASGFVLCLGTKWGVVRHWWVVAKLVITAALVVGGNGFLNPRLQLASERALALTGDAVTAAGLGAVRFPVAYVPGIAVVLLIAATALSTYKPWGRTRFGRRQAMTARAARTQKTTRMTPEEVAA